MPLSGAAPDAAEHIVLRLTVRAALAVLTAPQREALELAYYGGLSQSEIAERLGVPLGTIKSRMFTGLARLRETLEETAVGQTSG